MRPQGAAEYPFLWAGRRVFVTFSRRSKAPFETAGGVV